MVRPVRRRGRVLTGLAAGALVLLAACGGQKAASPGVSPSTPAASPSASSARTPGASSGAPSGTDQPSRSVTKLLVVVVENHSFGEMRAEMPYTFGLAQRFGYAADYHAIAHPSLPNYLAIVSGQTYGVADDASPAYHRLHGTTVFQQALDAGRTAGLYAEGMPSNCALEPSGTYAVKHNPWAYFVLERTACQRFDRPYGDLPAAIAAGRLPDAGMVIPDLCHDAHDCGLSVADGWFRDLMTRVFAGPDWRSGHLAVVLTADEDDESHGNRVLTVVIHPSQRHDVVNARLDHYSLTRLYEDVLHAPYLQHAGSAPSMSAAFGLPVG